MHDLIVAVLQLAVDLDVLDVKARKELEDFVGLPFGNVRLALLVLLFGQMLDLDLLFDCLLNTSGLVEFRGPPALSALIV